MAHEQHFVIISAAQITAKQVIVTPAVAPLAGHADLEAIGRNFPKGRRNLKGVVPNPAVAAELLIPLPKWARENDCIFWASYS
jgi:hypothetical protein